MGDPMLAIRTWSRCLLLAISLSITCPFALAQKSITKLPHQSTETNRTDTSSNTPQEAHQRAGSPELGVLILVGVVGFLVLIAWVISRIGEGSGRQSDNTLN